MSEDKTSAAVLDRGERADDGVTVRVRRRDRVERRAEARLGAARGDAGDARAPLGTEQPAERERGGRAGGRGRGGSSRISQSVSFGVASAR